MNIITGEKIQQQCDVYIGYAEDFNCNPMIRVQKEKHLDIHTLQTSYENPPKVFCYSNRIADLSNKIHLFKNKFILVSHNSDGEIHNCSQTLRIVNDEKVEKWYAQNICFEHEKLFFLPIGIANSQWKHGDLSHFSEMIQMAVKKTKKVYFNFNIETNRSKRQPCYDKLKGKLEWLPNTDPRQNIMRLQEYEFCICPEGNGVDTHRLWEAIYVKTIPIVIQSEFTEILKKNKVPVCIVNDWSNVDITKLNYSDYDITGFLTRVNTWNRLGNEK